ncbi:MAG: diaminopimelate epimerase [Planctomycetota bacterium]
MQFAKYQALGNDYLVVERDDWGDRLSPSAAHRICDRHFGIGSDGILVREPSSDPTEFRLRILNPDGSEAEKSGNGLRIFARYLWDKRLVSDAPFQVVTPGGTVLCQVKEQGRSVTVEMGQVRFHSRDIPVLGPPRDVIRETMEIAGLALEFTAATIGNPHCVILRRQVSQAEASSLGPLIETDSRFPNRTNVQFMQVLDRANIRIEIWERGAGYTLASGSSSCASAAVAKRLGLCDSSITVHMPGGSLAIEVDDNFFVRMTGPVEKVAEGKLSDESLGDGNETIETVEGIQYRTGSHVTSQGVLDLYRANGWSSAEKPQQLLSALLGSHSLVTAWDGERLVGLGNAITDGHLVVYYPHLLVHPEYQGRGVGTHLVRMLMDRYAGFHQHMLVADGKAIEFYRKCGFERAGQTEPMWIYAGHDH